MDYPDSVRFLYALGNEIRTAKLGLDRIRILMSALGDPQTAPARFVHVAGTNGKGSTSAMVESALRASGMRTGLFTSPHLLEPTERIRIDGVPVSSGMFADAFDAVHADAEELLRTGAIDMHPSYFETVTAMAFLLFRRAAVDITVLEVGLGGRLDATNIVEPELCVITPVDFDHEKFLGTSIEAIAAEKAGILKHGVPAVIAPQRPEAAQVIRDTAARLGAALIEPEAPEAVEVDRFGSRFRAYGLGLECPLAGRHQIGNAVTAVAALRELGIASDAITRGLRETRWPGRLTRIRRNPEVIVDGAHNPSGARTLAAYVSEFYRDPKPILIFGAMRDKAAEEMASVLFPCFQEVIVTAPHQERALAPDALRELADHPALRIAPDLKTALDEITEPDSVVFVSGSLFLVAEAIEFLP